MGSLAYNMDCMEAMRKMPDKYFDLAVVDPPYGGGSQFVHVERERERETGFAAEPLTSRAAGVPGSAVGLTTTISAARTGGKW